MKLVWTHPASADRKVIREYIARDNPAAALALDELFSEQASRLIDHSGLGRRGRTAGTRELVAHHNYILHLRHDRGASADTPYPARGQAMATGAVVSLKPSLFTGSVPFCRRTPKEASR